ncbi:MICOS complex subunit MIC13 homolog QIL1 [Ptiloglossa arizonensis]|uniref:MICOS complex subunit MIC13 homolog QIL1 n=1 Tax=Ptiloglossa arizonensis TaxID=3350558 RepID=UPI003FA16F01
MTFIRFMIKSTVVGSITYYTYYAGVWSKSEETAKLYGKIYNNVTPYIKHNIPQDIVYEYNQLPSLKVITNCARKSWNKGVMITMNYISDLPTHVVNNATRLSEIVQKYINEQSNK